MLCTVCFQVTSLGKYHPSDSIQESTSSSTMFKGPTDWSTISWNFLMSNLLPNLILALSRRSLIFSWPTLYAKAWPGQLMYRSIWFWNQRRTPLFTAFQLYFGPQKKISRNITKGLGWYTLHWISNLILMNWYAISYLDVDQSKGCVFEHVVNGLLARPAQVMNPCVHHQATSSNHFPRVETGPAHPGN